MGAQQDAFVPGHIALHFFGGDLARLDRVEFWRPASSSMITSTRLSGRRYSTQPSFRWNQSVRALSVLFLRAARRSEVGSVTEQDSSMALSGGAGSLAAHLEKAIASGQEWLTRMFGFAETGHAVFDELFVINHSASRQPKEVSIFVDRAILPPENIEVHLDGRLLSGTSEILELAAKLEDRPASLLLCPAPTAVASPLNPATRTEEMRHSTPIELADGVLNLFAAMRKSDTSGKLNLPEPQIGPGSEKAILVQFAHKVEVTILEGAGHSRVKFFFDIANFGWTTFADRSHQFWFEAAQDDVQFRCVDGIGRELPIEIVQSSPHFCELKVLFLEPLETAQRMQYAITYEVREDSFLRQFYYMRARTLTHLLSLTVNGAEGIDFSDSYVVQESSDGFLRDDPPLLVITREGSAQRLHWQVKSPRVGDLYRTFWTYARVASQDAVLRSGSASLPAPIGQC